MDGKAFSESIAAPIQIMQVLVIALVMGVVMFLCMAIFVIRQPPAVPPAQPAGLPLLVLVGVIGAVSMLSARGLVLQVLLMQERKRLSAELKQAAGDSSHAPEHVAAATMTALLAVLRKRLIVGAVLVEAAAMLNIVMFILERSPISLGVAVVLALVLAAHFPTRSYVETWIATEYEKLSS